MEAPLESCNFWLQKKNRFCANAPLAHSRYCGNHNPNSDQHRIPCPLDSSHCVLKQHLESHLKKCPFLKQAQALTRQPFYNKGINSVSCSDDEDEHPVTTTSANMKRTAVYNLPVMDFIALLHKIKSIHASLSHHIQQDSYKMPHACASWLKTQPQDGKLPFQERHVLQQASILGNMEELGILPPSNTPFDQQSVSDASTNIHTRIPSVVEFGAGRGYLTQMLADCYGIRQVFLVERRSYKLKADRSLRQKESLVLQRLRIDIEDLDLQAVESLKAVPYMAIGKHLCGSATDFTLRCCLRECCSQDGTRKIDNHLTGLAIATCCHHLCQWRNYVNRSYLSNLGITKDDFHAITMFTSWAVDSVHSSDLYDTVDQRSPLDLLVESKECNEDARGVEGIVRDMQPAERAVLGFMCKDIIDIGRLMWIRKHGLDGRFVKYVPSTISPENHLLIAR